MNQGHGELYRRTYCRRIARAVQSVLAEYDHGDPRANEAVRSLITALRTDDALRLALRCSIYDEIGDTRGRDYSDKIA